MADYQKYARLKSQKEYLHNSQLLDTGSGRARVVIANTTNALLPKRRPHAFLSTRREIGLLTRAAAVLSCKCTRGKVNWRDPELVVILVQEGTAF